MRANPQTLQRAAKRKQPKSRRETVKGLLYSVLCSVAVDINCPISFNSFCDEYGYYNDSIKSKETFDRCLAQRALLEDSRVSQDVCEFMPA